MLTVHTCNSLSKKVFLNGNTIINVKRTNIIFLM